MMKSFLADDNERDELSQVADEMRVAECGDLLIDRFSIWKRYRKIIISLFLCWNVYAITLYLCAPSPFRDRLASISNPYVWYTGLWQTFCVFSPPPICNVQLIANVTFKNGKTIAYEFPSTGNGNPFKDMLLERFRKWTSDNINAGSSPLLYPDAAKWVARKHENFTNPPVQVELLRHWTNIAPPGAPSSDVLSHLEKFYTYKVSPGDLQ